MTLRHFYHLWADGIFEQALTEHAAALLAANLPVVVTVTLVGGSANRDRAARLATEKLGSRYRLRWITADAGFEQVTLAALRRQARRWRGDTPVLYAHSKGAYFAQRARDLGVSPGDDHDRWRQRMTAVVIGRWQECTALLENGYDTAGPDWFGPAHAEPHYSGNFWWATAGYLASLPEPATESRFQAETWLGLGRPKAASLNPRLALMPSIIWASEDAERSFGEDRALLSRGADRAVARGAG